MRDRVALLWQLFFVLFKVGAFTFGGGYAMIPLVRHELVTRREWLRDDEFVDCLTVAQTSPGPVAVNTAAVVGFRMAGLSGAAVGALGAALPSFVVMLIIAVGLRTVVDHPLVAAALHGLRPAVAALIVAAAIRLGQRSVRGLAAAMIFVGALAGLLAFGWHPVLVLIGAGSAGIVFCRREVLR